MPAALLAAALAAFGHLMGWSGVDTAAQVYRVDSYRANGFALWDSRWYGGHWTLDYSVLYPPLASWVGVLTVTILSAAAAALAFDRLARANLGPGGPAASWLFAAGTLVSASIGQLTFLSGEAFGLAALWAATGRTRGRYAISALLALGCTFTSPLTGAFLALAAVAWGIDLVRRRDALWLGAAGLAALAGLPILAAAVLFPGDGPMPYPAIDWAWEMVVAGMVGLLAWRRAPAVAAGAALWMLAATVSELVPSALGGNVGRIEDMAALPLAVGLAASLGWSRTRMWLPVAAVPLALSQWAPAWGAFTAAPSAPSTHRSFYAALGRRLAAESGPPGRVEVVPTRYHWEAAYVAAYMPLARGWERQLDAADNPIFYRPGRLDPISYRAWLVDNGVRFVALPSAPLDSAGRAEGALVASNRVPGLRLVWSTPQWHLYEVQGGPGIVSGPARLVRTSGQQVVLDAGGPGRIEVRIRWSPDWFVTGDAGCLARAGSWMSLAVERPGPVSLQLSLWHPGRTPCPGPLASNGPPAAGRTRVVSSSSL